MTSTQQDKLAISIAETASMLGVSRGVVRKAIDDGLIPGVRFGRRIVVPTAPLQRRIEELGLQGLLGLEHPNDPDLG